MVPGEDLDVLPDGKMRLLITRQMHHGGLDPGASRSGGPDCMQSRSDALAGILLDLNGVFYEGDEDRSMLRESSSGPGPS